MENLQLLDIATSLAVLFNPSEHCEVGGVAAALVTESSDLFTGVCVDMACSIGFCAEHSAVAEMLKARQSVIKVIVAVNADGGVMPPCAIDSVSRSRIITYGQQTLIAQLTMAALRDSSVNAAGLWLTVRPGAAPGGVGVQIGDACHDESTPAAEPAERVECPRVTPQRGTITDG